MSGRNENNGFKTPEKKRPNNGLGPESFRTPRICITIPENITYAPTRPKNKKDFFEDNTKIIFPKI
jgi:hypothetical protein